MVNLKINSTVSCTRCTRTVNHHYECNWDSVYYIINVCVDDVVESDVFSLFFFFFRETRDDQ